VVEALVEMGTRRELMALQAETRLSLVVGLLSLHLAVALGTVVKTASMEAVVEAVELLVSG
jgi:hypothetical protein